MAPLSPRPHPRLGGEERSLLGCRMPKAEPLPGTELMFLEQMANVLRGKERNAPHPNGKGGPTGTPEVSDLSSVLLALPSLVTSFPFTREV